MLSEYVIDYESISYVLVVFVILFFILHALSRKKIAELETRLSFELGSKVAFEEAHRCVVEDLCGSFDDLIDDITNTNSTTIGVKRVCGMITQQKELFARP